MPRKPHKPWLTVAAILVVAALMPLVWLASQTPARAPLPSPNGYDDFIQAGQAITRSAVDYARLDPASLRAWVATNAVSLRRLRAGLTRPCAMPMDIALTNLYSDRLADLKRLARLLIAEGRVREMDHQPADAARCYTDLIRFGNELSRGGVLITRLMGIACEAMGSGALAAVVPQLRGEDSRGVLRELEQVDAGRVTWEEVRKNERYYTRHQLKKQWNPLAWVMAWRDTRQALAVTETKHKKILAQERLVAGELALRAYQTKRGRPPARLDDLVTNYLRRVPPDPFTGQPMAYRPQGTHWLLYSVGPDGVDDGGRPAGRGSPARGDLLFDSAW